MSALQPMRNAIVLAVLAAVSMVGNDCAAQVRRYQPYSPTLSPYLDLTLRNNRGIPNYYAFVRPRLEQRAFNQQAQALTRQHGTEIQRLQNDVQRGITSTTQTGIGSWFMTNGTRTTYLDTTSYYPAVNVRPRP